jgi:hypothetical protein
MDLILVSSGQVPPPIVHKLLAGEHGFSSSLTFCTVQGCLAHRLLSEKEAQCCRAWALDPLNPSVWALDPLLVLSGSFWQPLRLVLYRLSRSFKDVRTIGCKDKFDKKQKIINLHLQKPGQYGKYIFNSPISGKEIFVPELSTNDLFELAFWKWNCGSKWDLSWNNDKVGFFVGLRVEMFFEEQFFQNL